MAGNPAVSPHHTSPCSLRRQVSAFNTMIINRLKNYADYVHCARRWCTQKKVGDLIWGKMCKLYHSSNKKRAKRWFWKEAEVTFSWIRKSKNKSKKKLYGGDAERRSLKAGGQRSERCHWEGFRHQLVRNLTNKLICMEIGVHIILNKYKNRLDLRCLSFIVSAKLTGSLQPFGKLKKNPQSFRECTFVFSRQKCSICKFLRQNVVLKFLPYVEDLSFRRDHDLSGSAATALPQLLPPWTVNSSSLIVIVVVGFLWLFVSGALLAGDVNTPI